MIVFRLSKSIYAKDLSGKGAEMSGGRWNSKGIPMIYTSESRALCTAEIAVHTSLGNIPADYFLTSIEIPKNIALQSIGVDLLPYDWKSFPHSYATQIIGDTFSREKKSLVLKVPSAVVQGEFNYLINPLHTDIRFIKIKNTEAFSFDKRLFLKE
jgi:RES domain-containing protein